MNNTSNNSQKNPFFIPFFIIVLFALVEFFGGIYAQSLALLGDAWHMFSDALALGLAMYAAYRVNHNHQSRAGLVASTLNVILMLIVIAWIVFEAIERLNQPRQVAGSYVMIIALIGLIINVIVAKQLHQHNDAHNLNHQAALLHVIGDLLGSIAALAAGLVIYLTGWLLIDPILSLVIALILLVGTFNLSKQIWLSVSGKAISQPHEHHH